MERQNVIRRGSHVGLPTIHQTDTQTFLSLRQVRNLLSAAFYAEAVGMQLFLFLTIAWRETPHFQNRDDQWNELQRRVFADLHSFCHARQIPLAYIWVRERKPGIGAHTHVLLYLGRGQIRPRTAVVRLKAILRRRYSFGPRGLHFGWKPDASDRFDRLAYLLKATDSRAFRYVGLAQQDITEALGLTLYTDRQQGRIRLKRCGTSLNLASSARAKRGDWREMRDLDAYKRALHEPYFALLQLSPVPQPPDPALSPGEQLIVRHRDPAYYHWRRCAHYRRLRLPTSEAWPQHLI